MTSQPTTFQPLRYRFVPAANHPAAYTLLLLHGTGGDENDLLDVGRQLMPSANLLGIRGNVLENRATNRFFKRTAEGVFDEDDLRFRTQELKQFVDSLAEKEGFDPSKLLVLGYSNGANIAGGLLMLYPNWLKGAVLWRPMLPLHNQKLGHSAGTQVLMTSAQQDQYFRPVEMNHYEQLLAENGFIVTHHLLPGGHNLSRKDVDLTLEWLSTRFH